MPDGQLESFRAGWPNYAPYGEDGEIIVCHDFAVKQLYMLTRDEKGVGGWTETLIPFSSGPPTLACPRMITAGVNHNTIHIVSDSYYPYMGQDVAMVYSRSQDGGLTWNIENEVVEGTGPGYYNGIYVDGYVWADERAGTIALLCGTSWYDLFMLKSTNDGDSWEKTVIWEHPYPFFDWNTTVTDTFFCTDNSASIALDSEGKAHVVFGISRVLHNVPGNNFWVFPEVDGIGYWNETMGPFTNDLDALAPPGYGYANSEMIEDYNYIGWMQDVNGNGTIDLNSQIMWYTEMGASTMPTITIDDQDRIFVLFSSTTETYEYDIYNYKHIWERSFSDGTWHSIIDLTVGMDHLYDECIYPVLGSSSDDSIYYIYNADDTPGLAFDQKHSYQENRIIFGKQSKSELIVGDEGISIKNPEIEFRNYPNPFSSSTTIEYHLGYSGLVDITILNRLGQVVDKISQYGQKGRNQLTWNAGSLPAGIYFCLITSGKQADACKMVKW